MTLQKPTVARDPHRKGFCGKVWKWKGCPWQGPSSFGSSSEPRCFSVAAWSLHILPTFESVARPLDRCQEAKGGRTKNAGKRQPSGRRGDPNGAQYLGMAAAGPSTAPSASSAAASSNQALFAEFQPSSASWRLLSVEPCLEFQS